MIKAQAVGKTVSTSEGALCILNNINLAIEDAETVAIVGSSGSGKSTLLGLLAGLDVPSTGVISLNNIDITQLNEDERARVRADFVGFVFQSFQLLPSLTALENVMLPAELSGVEGARELAESYLQRVGLEKRFSHYPRQLSGGEQQRVAIARAFASQPKLLFADEPTGNLDTATGAQIIDLLFALNREESATLIMVTHEQRLSERCGRTIRLEGGEIVDDSKAGNAGSEHPPLQGVS